MDKLHEHQINLIRKLSFGPLGLRFKELLISDLESEHMNYHLKKLIELGIVEKGGEFYTLTNEGKEYSDRLDDDKKIVEKQAKLSVIVNVVRNKHHKVEYLLSRRLKHPYYGKVGRIGGKVLYGETTRDAAARELKEETGLVATKLVLEEVYRKIRKDEGGKVLQDVFFYIYFVSKVRGKLKSKTEFQENFWASRDVVFDSDKYDPYEDLKLEERLKPHKLKVSESVGIAKGY